ncbi:MAG TPA: methyltransferase domain-containing protein [Chloroflexia bacterium]|nr:methyltransferase domain-containing protein [Chloroflexia bacterium]
MRRPPPKPPGRPATRPASRPPPARERPRPTAERSFSEVECEAEVIPGLGAVAQSELESRLGGRAALRPGARPDTLSFRYRGDLRVLLDLRAVVAVYLTRIFAVPRPRGLLGHEHFTALVAMVKTVQDLHRPGAFRTLRFSAAGDDSAVLTRLKTELAERTGLHPGDEDADLLLRLRRAGAGWEALVRLSPRPLTARAWRVCNLPGALNAVVGHAMVALSAPAAGDRYLNLVCGSGTLLIERLAVGPAASVLGCDNDPQALQCAAANLAAAGQVARVTLIQADAGALPLPAASCDVLTADLPFGQLVGSHAGNERLYPRLLAEATRVAAPGARMLLITHEVRLLERLLALPSTAAAWDLVETVRITLPFGAGGLNPRIYRLQRRADS